MTKTLPDLLDYERIIEEAHDEWMESETTSESLGSFISRACMRSALRYSIDRDAKEVVRCMTLLEKEK